MAERRAPGRPSGARAKGGGKSGRKSGDVVRPSVPEGGEAPVVPPLTAGTGRGTSGRGPVTAWRPDDGVVALGVGLAAAGMGAVIGLAAERIAVARVVRSPAEQDAPGDGRGGPALGSLRGEARMVVSDGVSLHVEVDEPEDGASPITVVLSHGYALDLDSWHYQRQALRGRYRLVLWDQRGHGRSGTGPEGSSTIDQVGADLGAVIDEVAPDGPLVLLGHSMGGMTVMSLAARRPEIFTERVLAVGLVSTSAGGLRGVDLGLSGIGRLAMSVAPTAARLLARQPGLVARGRRIGSDLESLLVRRYSFSSPVPPQLVGFAARMIAQTRMEVISDFLPTFSGHDKREALSVLHGHEILVMVGDRDLLTPAEQSEEIVRLLPEAEHVVVQRAGHLLPLEHPELVNNHLDELLAAAEVVLGATSRPARRLGWGRRTVTPVRQALGPKRRGRTTPTRSSDKGRS